MPSVTASRLVIIPAFNEEDNIARVVEDVHEHLPGAQVLVVDDGSGDATAAAARAAGASVARLPVNLGYGAALQTGYKFANRQGFRSVAQMDADGQHLARYLPELLAVVEGGQADLAIGSRFLGGDDHYQPSVPRRIGMALFGGIASLAMGKRITDPTSGYQALDAKVVHYFCSDVYPSDFPDADVLLLLHRKGFKVEELPVQMRMSDGPSMHGGHGSVYYVYKMLLSIALGFMRSPSEERNA